MGRSCPGRIMARRGKIQRLRLACSGGGTQSITVTFLSSHAGWGRIAAETLRNAARGAAMAKNAKSKKPIAKKEQADGAGPNRKEYEAELYKLHVELVKLQQWVQATKAKICII